MHIDSAMSTVALLVEQVRNEEYCAVGEYIAAESPRVLSVIDAGYLKYERHITNGHGDTAIVVTLTDKVGN